MTAKTTSNPVRSSRDDAYRALDELARHLNVKHLVDPARDIVWREETRNGHAVLVEYEDIAYHGSPLWKPTGSLIDNERTVEAVRALRSLRQLL